MSSNITITLLLILVVMLAFIGSKNYCGREGFAGAGKKHSNESFLLNRYKTLAVL